MPLNLISINFLMITNIEGVTTMIQFENRVSIFYIFKSDYIYKQSFDYNEGFQVSNVYLGDLVSSRYMIVLFIEYFCKDIVLITGYRWFFLFLLFFSWLRL